MLVGREREFGELAGALESALSGRGRVVLLSGEGGIGKTRLCFELIALLAAEPEPPEIWLARGDPMRAASPFALLGQLLRSACGIHDEDDEMVRRARLRARIEAAVPGVAAHLRELLQDSEIRNSHVENDPRVQDAYCLRCMPQVHGAVRMALAHAIDVVQIESGSATDNPLVFAETGEVLSGGNFHGAPLALVYDYAAIALTDLMSITERRIDRLVNPDENEDLPPFLTTQPGVGSGFMMLQIVAASLLNEAKVLAHPASIDNVPTDGGKEDHVSMGMTAATKLRAITELAERMVAIELIAAAEGLEYRKPLKPGRGAHEGYEVVRTYVRRLSADRSMSAEIQAIADAVEETLRVLKALRTERLCPSDWKAGGVTGDLGLKY